jgi:hypothetical protein
MPSNNADNGSRSVTRQDIAGALLSMSVLPKKAAIDHDLEFESYVTALTGVTTSALAEAAKQALRGELGHAFFPNPAELRIACSEVMLAERRATSRAAEAERNRKEMAEYARTIAQRTDASRQRVADLVRRLHAEIDGRDDEAELAAIRSKYDPAKLATVPDRSGASR